MRTTPPLPLYPTHQHSLPHVVTGVHWLQSTLMTMNMLWTNATVGVIASSETAMLFGVCECDSKGVGVLCSKFTPKQLQKLVQHTYDNYRGNCETASRDKCGLVGDLAFEVASAGKQRNPTHEGDDTAKPFILPKKSKWPCDTKKDGILMQLEARGARAMFFTELTKEKGQFAVGETHQLDADEFGLMPRLFS